MKTFCFSCIFRKFREKLLYFYSVSFPCEHNVQIPEASRCFAPMTPILMIDVIFLYISAKCIVFPPKYNKTDQFATVLSPARSKLFKTFSTLPFNFIQIPLKVAFILEKSRLYFRDDSPVIPIFFQPECRAMPAIYQKVHCENIDHLV